MSKREKVLYLLSSYAQLLFNAILLWHLWDAYHGAAL